MNKIDEDVEIGPETMTVEKENQNIVETVRQDIKDEHIGEKMELVLETPGGSSEIFLNGDYESNILIVDLLCEALESKYSTGTTGVVNFYTKPATMIPEAEFLGKDTKFEPNTVGAMIGLLQKSGKMTDSLNMKCVDCGDTMMPVEINSSEGNVTLSLAKGSPFKDDTNIVNEPAIPEIEFMAPIM